MAKTWAEIVSTFPTTPYLFVGSGLTRRYYNLPSWKELLQHFCSTLSVEKLKFAALASKFNSDYAKIGEELEREFNEKWFSDPLFRTKFTIPEEEVTQKNTSPFKIAVCDFIKNRSHATDLYRNEISTLKSITEFNISGIITTNYDKFFESITKGYKTYSGQDQLLFSSTQDIAEIFKIHGSIDDPSSIILTDSDYKNFNQKATFLAAKLLTIFIEYPIIFIGYSLTDKDIRNILSSIVQGLSPTKIDKLTNRLIFIQRNQSLKDNLDISKYEIDINGVTLPMTKIETDNFDLIFKELKNKKSAYPVRILRMFREELYQYTLTNQPSKHFLVAPYDPKVPEDKLIYSLGVSSNHLQGLTGLTAIDWYKSILFPNKLSEYKADDLLTYTYPTLFRKSNILPVYKYLSQAKEPHPEIRRKSFDNMLNNTIRKNRSRYQDLSSVSNVISRFKDNDTNIVRYLTYLTEDKIDTNELRNYLTSLLTRKPNALEEHSISTDLRRLIRIYDLLFFGHKKEEDSKSIESSS